MGAQRGFCAAAWFPLIIFLCVKGVTFKSCEENIVIVCKGRKKASVVLSMLTSFPVSVFLRSQY